MVVERADTIDLSDVGGTPPVAPPPLPDTFLLPVTAGND
jgi:hypothetical protein